MCCTNHLDPHCGCKVISSSGPVEATAAESSSMTMIEAWSFYEEGSVATAFSFFTATRYAARSSVSDVSCSWYSSSKSSINASTWASAVAPSSSS